ncbi:hypothetical protein ACFL2V_02920 [Pseudomonadota bacterium]
MKRVENGLYENDLLLKDMATCIWNTSDCVVHSQQVYESLDSKEGTFADLIFVELYLNTVLNEDGHS